MTELDPRLLGNPATPVSGVLATDTITINREGVSVSATLAALDALLGSGLTIDAIIVGINVALGGTAWQSGGGSSVWGAITGTIDNQTDLATTLGGYVAKSGSTMTGALVAASFSVASGHLVSAVGDAIRTAFDSNDYYEYDKGDNAFLFVIGGSEKLKLSTTLDVKSQRIVNVADAVDDGDAVSKSYLITQLETITPGSGDGLPAAGVVGGLQYFEAPGTFGQDATHFLDLTSKAVRGNHFVGAVEIGGSSVATVSGTYNPVLSAQTIQRNVTGSNFVLGAPTGYSPPNNSMLAFQLILKNIDSTTKTFTAPSYAAHGYKLPELVLLPNILTEFWLIHYDGVWRISGPPVIKRPFNWWFPGTPQQTSGLLWKEYVHGVMRVPLDPLSIGAPHCEVTPTATTEITFSRRQPGGIMTEHLRVSFPTGSNWGVWTAKIAGVWSAPTEAAVITYTHGDQLHVAAPASWNGMQGLLLPFVCGV